MANLKPMTAKRLANVVFDDSKANQRFCFILGAGASVTSGIRAGKKLIELWRRELMEIGDTEYFKDCASDAKYDWEKCKHIFDDGYAPNSMDYFMVYGLRFAETGNAGYHFLEEEMKGAKPSIGYYCLASILDKSPNKLVITTNFDPLTEDALFYSSGKHPLVLGHESLASFMGDTVDRPVVAKIHRDLLLAPMNREEEMQQLKEEWREPLRNVLSQCIPIVVGYAGGDHTLMSLLLEEDFKCKKVYWCTPTFESELPEDAERVITKHGGRWVQIEGFDELMFQLAMRFSVIPDAEEMRGAAEKRLDQYDSACKKFYSSFEASAQSRRSGPLPEQISDAALTASNGKAGAALKEYDKLFAESVQLWYGGKHQEAIDKCGEAIALQPKQAGAYSNRGAMYHNLDNYEQALTDYNKAVELEPKSAEYRYNRAVTLRAMSRYEEALLDADKAVGKEPDNAQYCYIRALIRYNMRQYEEALTDYNKAIELEPDTAEYRHGRAVILHALKRYSEALEDRNKAIELNVNNALYYYQQSVTLYEMGRYPEARDAIHKALEIDPDNKKYQKYRDEILNRLNADSDEPAPV